MLDRILKLSGIRKRLPPLPPGRADITLREPKARTLKQQIDKGDWRAARDTIRPISDATLRGLLVQVCASTVGGKAVAWIDEWSRSFPDEALTWTVRGAISAHAAGLARGTDRASETSDQQWEEMYELMDVAETQLEHAIALDDQDAVPWRILLTMATATSRELDVRTGLYDEARKRSGPWFSLDHAMISTLTKKWGGSHQLMFDFARRASSAAPVKSAFPALIAIAHYEMVLYAVAFEEKLPSPRPYFADRAVKNEIREAAAKATGCQGPAAVVAANYFAWAFSFMGDLTAARHWLERTQGVSIGPPWWGTDHAAAVREVNAKFS